MLDVETLGVGGRCVILSCGIVPFDIETGQTYENDSFHERINKAHSLNEGFTSTPSTMAFWNTQPKAQREWEFGGKLTILEFCQSLTIYLDKVRKRWGTFAIWASASKLDFGGLFNLFEHVGMKFPIPYTAERCTRTIRAMTKDVCPVEKSYETRGITHNAIDDCIAQIKELCKQMSFISVIGNLNPPQGGSGVPDKILNVKIN